MNKKQVLELALKKKMINEGLKEILSLDEFVLTGSYFFDCQNKESDFDFFIRESELVHIMERLLCDSYNFEFEPFSQYSESDTSVRGVFVNYNTRVHIQVIKDMYYGGKRKANDLLHLQTEFLLSGVSSNRTRRDLYKRVTNKRVWQRLVLDMTDWDDILRRSYNG